MTLKTGVLFLCINQPLFGSAPQIREAERIHHTCAHRERQLKRLHGWIEEQKKQLDQTKHPAGQTLARKTLLDLEVQ